MNEARHIYPARYPRGAHWALDEAGDILDTFTPGALPYDTRVLLAAMIWGTIMRLNKERGWRPGASPPSPEPQP